MNQTRIAEAAVRFVERVPTVVWAVWIVAVVVGAGVLALQVGPAG